MSKTRRIGVLGGTFDPPHNTHVAMARAALDAFALERVLFVVAGQPPHKFEGPFATPAERLAMVEAALENEPGMESCDIEVRRAGPSYTRDTLEQLQERFPDAELVLILGQDSVIDLPRWRDPEGILDRARLAVAQRPGFSEMIPPTLAPSCDVLPFEATDLSSTTIRESIEAGGVHRRPHAAVCARVHPASRSL